MGMMGMLTTKILAHSQGIHAVTSRLEEVG